MAEKHARLAVLALVLAAPLVYLPRVLFGSAPEAPLDMPPVWMHLVVVTVGEWPDVDGALKRSALGRFDRRASRVAAAFAPSPSRAATAASLWTGRWPRHHGVLANDLALAEGSWTLAAAARTSGARTAAYLQEPFASATGIGGFDEVEEGAAFTASDLARRGAAFLEGRAGERAVLWLHLADAGPGGEAVDALLAGLEPALEPIQPETALALAVFRRGDFAGDVEPLGAPLWVALPGALNAGRRGDARVSLVDLAGMLRIAMRLPPPRADRGQRAPQSRAELLVNALRGGGPRPWVLVQGPPDGEDVWQTGDRRVVARWATGEARAEARAGSGWHALDDETAAPLLGQARRLAQELAAGLTSARTAVVPAGEWPASWR